MDNDPLVAQVISQITILLVLTLVNAFFSGSEMAVVSVNKIRIHVLAEEGNKNAKLIEKLTEDSTVFLSTIQVAITLAGFFSSASAATGIAQLFAEQLSALSIPYAGTIASVSVTIILAYFNLVLGELVPKRIALQKAEQFSLLCVRPIYYLSVLIKPFIKLLTISTALILKLFGMHNKEAEEKASEEEIRALLIDGEIKDTEKEMISSVFSFDDKKAREVMVHRQDMVAIDLNAAIDQNLETIFSSRYTRVPAYRDTIDHIEGIISTKELMIQTYNTEHEKIDLTKAMMPAYFTPETSKTDSLFYEMQKNKIRMAILIDEYGGVSGLVTLEDLVEEIVGDIQDEYDKEEKLLLKEIVMNKEYEVSGSISLYDLNEEIGIEIKSRCDTLSGYLLGCLSYIPDETQLPITVSDEFAEYLIESMDGKVIDKVRIQLHENTVQK